MSVRTYCVIPHCAREDTSFFQGVFEDGLRVLYQGRLQSLLFSHVLSPAHDYVKHINGPLLATLRDGGNATLFLATPSSEHVPPTPASGAAASSSSSSASPSSSSSSCEGIAEITATVMGLYRQLFPLLFRNVEHCPAARLSVLTVSATERVLLDNLDGDRRLRSVGEGRQLHVHRRSSATEWGTVLQLLEDRHVALESSATSLEGQTACVVTVELEGHGRLVVVDAASSQELLQQLTLILGMESDGEARTYPPHTPLRDLLAGSVPPAATVQVVCCPAPQDTVRQTMRVLHFGSTVETWRGKQNKRNSGNSSNDASMDESANRARNSATLLNTSSTRKSTTTHGEVGGTSKLFLRPTGSPSVSFDVDYEPHTLARRSDFQFREAEKEKSFTRHRSTLKSLEHSDSEMSDISTSGARSPRNYTEHMEGHSSLSPRASTPGQLPPPSVSVAHRDQPHPREAQLQRRIAALEAQVGDLETANTQLRQAREAAVREKEGVALELQSKSSLWADLQRAHRKTKQENADYAQLVKKLLQQVRVLEKDTSRQKRQDVTVVKELRQVREEKKELEEQLTRLRKEVMLFRRDATYRAREATLSRIVHSDISVPPQGAGKLSAGGAAAAATAAVTTSLLSDRTASGRGRSVSSTLQRSNKSGINKGSSSHRPSSPRARRLYDSSSTNIVADEDGAGSDAINDMQDNTHDRTERSSANDETRDRVDGGGGGGGGQGGAPPPLSARAQRVFDITVEELRWRNRHLEQEVARLQERLLRALSPSASAAEGKQHTQPPNLDQAPSAPGAARCPLCSVMQERVNYFQQELTHMRAEKDRLFELLQASKENQQQQQQLESESGDEGEEEASDTVDSLRGKPRKQTRDRDGQQSRLHERSVSFQLPDTERKATRDVAAALLAGCASLQAQLACAQSVLQTRLRRSADAHDAATHTDPLSRISAQVLAEHYEAVSALAASLQHIAEKPATRPLPLAAAAASSASLMPQRHTSRSNSVMDSLRGQSQEQQSGDELLPAVPRTATAGNVETLTHYLTFEAERCRHLRAFVPTFAQLAVATEHLLMRLEATEPDA